MLTIGCHFHDCHRQVPLAQHHHEMDRRKLRVHQRRNLCWFQDQDDPNYKTQYTNIKLGVCYNNAVY